MNLITSGYLIHDLYETIKGKDEFPNLSRRDNRKWRRMNRKIERYNKKMNKLKTK